MQTQPFCKEIILARKKKKHCEICFLPEQTSIIKVLSVLIPPVISESKQPMVQEWQLRILY